MRAKGLEQGLQKFIVGDQQFIDILYKNPLVASLVPEDALVTKILDKIPGFNKLIRTDEKQPVNISAQTFAIVLFDTLIPGKSGLTSVETLKEEVAKLPEKMPMRAPILHIISTAADDINKVRTQVENWFDATMVKTTESYRAHMWHIALGLSMAFAVVLNVDTINIARILWDDSSLRSALNIEANTYAKSNDQQQNAIYKLNALGLPIGWTITNNKELCVAPNDWFPRPRAGVNVPAPVNDPCTFPLPDWYDCVIKVAGWVITALAGAQGAPFWFDILKKATHRG